MPPMAAEGIASVVAQVRAVRIPAAAHSAYFERAELFNTIVDEFLATLGR